VIEVFAAGVGIPVGVFFEEFDVEAVEAAGGLDVESVFADLLDGGNAGQGQEEAEVIVEVLVVTGDRLAINEVFGLKGFAIGGEDEFGFLLFGGFALTKGGERACDFAFGTDF
jgi:hypothetical protein